MNIRIVLIGEHQLTLLGLAQLVRGAPQMQMAGMLARSDGAVGRAKRAAAHVAVLDIPHAGETHALSVCRALADAGVAVVAYCESEAPGTVQRALDAGALGVVSKSEDTAEVLRAGYVVARGKRHISPGMQSAVGPAESAEVTPRQRELLRLMADGLDTEDAASALGVSPETVKTHVEGVMSKLGASGRTEAVAIALRRGIIR
jgi:two-component system NarL family response regulator